MWHVTVKAKLQRFGAWQAPHHFQRRQGAHWVFEESPMRGELEHDIPIVIRYVRAYLKKRRTLRS
jgi:hypothetical protein